MRVEVGSTLKPSEHVKLQAFEVSRLEKQDILHDLLRKESGRCLVFARTKSGADRIARSLSQQGINAATIHGDRSRSQRTAALSGFQQGRFRVLVATDLAARGIHVEDIAHVINYDLPDTAENYIHRVGRTGRAGRRGVASALISPDERGELMQLERALGVSIEKLRLEANRQQGRPENMDGLANLHHVTGPATRRSLQLPGEFLQIQMVN